MKRYFSSLDRYSIVEGILEEASINGVGGTIGAALWVPLNLSISHTHMAPQEGIRFSYISAKLCMQQSQAFSSIRIDLDRIITPRFHAITEQVTLAFPLDAVKVAALERARAGGDLKLRIEATLGAEQLIAINPDRPSNTPEIWSNLKHHMLYLADEFTILRDTWIKRVLPNVGYGVVHVIELPAVSVDACADIQHSFAALQQANDRHLHGHYDDAVGKCRVAMEPFLTIAEEDDGTGGKRKKPRLKPSWETKMGHATGNWLAESFNAVKYAGNPSHHSPNTHYGQLESQIILAVTTALVAYAARVQKNNTNE